MHPSCVVVDTRDGYVFRAGSDGILFTWKTAEAFRDQRNAGLKPEHRTYEMFSLVHCPGIRGPVGYAGFGMHEHDGYAAHSHEVRADHLAVPRQANHTTQNGA